MRICIIGKFDEDSFGFHIVYTLRKLKHNVDAVEIGVKYTHGSKLTHRFNQLRIYGNDLLGKIKQVKRIKTRKLLDQISTEIDLVIVTHDFLEPTEVKQIKEKTKAFVVLWFPDAIVNFRKTMFLNAPYDFLFFKDSYIPDVLNRDLKGNFLYLPECSNPDFHYPVKVNNEEKARYVSDIATIGNLYSNRVAFFEGLTDLSLQIKIWGNPATHWMDVEKIRHMLNSEFLVYENKSKVFGGAKIILNNLHPAEIYGINARAFEIAACKGFQLINYRKDIEQLFSQGREIITFKDRNDLIEKIRYFLDHEDERQRIAEAGYQRVIKEHTYSKRLQQIFDVIFINSDYE